MGKLQWTLSADRQSVSLTVTGLKKTTLDAKALGEMLDVLGDFYSVMPNGLPLDWAVDQKMQAVVDPHWRTEPEMMQGEPILHVRDPCYGWRHYLIPRAEAKKMGQSLIDIADAPPPTKPTGKVN